MKRKQPERTFQTDLCRFLDVALPPGAWYSAIPGGNRSVTTTPGYRSGTPDLLIVYKGRAIFLELKAPKNYATALQRGIHADLMLAGAVVHTVRDIGAAYEFLVQFIPLKGKPQ